MIYAHNYEPRIVVGIASERAGALRHADGDGKAGSLPKACYPLRVKLAGR
jgi:hypothetical protein